MGGWGLTRKAKESSGKSRKMGGGYQQIESKMSNHQASGVGHSPRLARANKPERLGDTMGEAFFPQGLPRQVEKGRRDDITVRNECEANVLWRAPRKNKILPLDNRPLNLRRGSQRGNNLTNLDPQRECTKRLRMLGAIQTQGTEGLGQTGAQGKFRPQQQRSTKGGEEEWTGPYVLPKVKCQVHYSIIWGDPIGHSWRSDLV